MAQAFEVPKELLARCVNKTELVQRVLNSFVVQLDQDIPCLVKYVDKGSAEETRRLAHRIKGAAANVSAETLRTHAARLEACASSQRMDEAQLELAGLRESWSVYKNQTATFISGEKTCVC